MATSVPPNTQPKLMTMRVQGAWTGSGLRTDVKVRHFDPLVMDEPEELGGSDQGPNPMEYMLGALIGCESVVLAIVAGEQGFAYTGVSFDLRGTLDLRGLEGVDGVRPYFEKITGTIKVETPESSETLQALAEEVERRCPVYTTLEAANVTFDVTWQAV